MGKILRKRVLRSLKSNPLRYIALSLIIILGMYMVVRLVGAADTVITRIDEKAKENKLEDGEFKVFVPLTEGEKQKIKDKGVFLEDMFYLEFNLSDKSTIRVFNNRKNINLIDVDKGRTANKKKEAVIEKRYSEEHHLSLGDNIIVGDNTLKIVGIGTVPDYDAMYKEFSDSSVESSEFGLVFVNDDQYKEYRHSKKSVKSEEYIYAYRLNGKMTDKELKNYIKDFNFSPDNVDDKYFKEYWDRTAGKKDEFLKGVNKLDDGSQKLKNALSKINQYSGKSIYGITETTKAASDLSDGMQKLRKNTNDMFHKYFKTDISNLVQFTKASDNIRIKASSNDQVINKYSGLISGIILMILFTYVISVFVIHEIEKERSVIGSLYALGVKKKDLIMHYLTLPVVVTMISGIIGTVIGFSKYGLNLEMKDCYNYFSVPNLTVVHPIYLIIYGIVMPPVVAIIVNLLVINKKLSQPALKLIHNEQKNNKFKNVNLGNIGFINRFRIRQMIREGRTGFTVIMGLFISLLIVMLSLDCYVMCKNVSIENKSDTKYEYMYNYKYPEEKVLSKGETGFAKTLSKEIYGYNLDVTLLGIDKDNSYFDAKVEKQKNSVFISSAVAYKYHLKVNDKLILTDNQEDRDYVFTVKGIVKYSTGLFVFMDIDSMRDLFGQSEDYYNVVFSDKPLDIDSERLYSITTKEDISKSSDVFITKMMPMIWMLLIISIIIFCTVMYLMIKVMIERSSFNISLIKIFGYRNNEIRKLYLDGNFYIILVGAAISIPLSKKLMDLIYPLLIANIGCAVNMDFTWKIYLGIYVSIIILYLIINKILQRKLKRVVPAKVLKNRE